MSRHATLAAKIVLFFMSASLVNEAPPAASSAKAGRRGLLKRQQTWMRRHDCRKPVGYVTNTCAKGEPPPVNETSVLPVPPEWAKRAYADDVTFRSMHAAALADPEAFWGLHGKRLDWIKPYTKVKDTSFNEADFHIRWYWDGVLNVSANCIAKLHA